MKSNREKNDEQKRQRSLIRAFDREMLSCHSFGLPAAWRMRFHGFAGIFFFLFPIQTVYNSDWTAIWFLIYSWSIIAPLNYVSVYLYLKENTKGILYYEKIKYLPIDPTQLRLVRIGYLLQFLGRTLPIALILQCVVSLVFYRALSVFHILHVLFFGGILPFLITGTAIWLQIDL